MPVTLHGRDQLRQKRNEPFATDIIDCAPGRDQGGLHRGAVSTDPAARLPSGPFAPQNVVQKPCRVLPMEPGRFKELIQDSLLLRSRRILVANRRS